MIVRTAIARRPTLGVCSNPELLSESLHDFISARNVSHVPTQSITTDIEPFVVPFGLTTGCCPAYANRIIITGRHRHGLARRVGDEVGIIADLNRQLDQRGCIGRANPAGYTGQLVAPCAQDSRQAGAKAKVRSFPRRCWPGPHGCLCQDRCPRLRTKDVRHLLRTSPVMSDRPCTGR